MSGNKGSEIESALAALNGSAADWERFLSENSGTSLDLAGVDLSDTK